MTQDEIIDMARHIADTFGTRMCDEHGDTHGEELYAMSLDDIVDAVKLVAAAEREACAKVCYEVYRKWVCESDEDVNYPDPNDCIRAIRARGEA